ncbi:pectin lyase-like protein [Exidia glandulosa HHB12029]|uniref:galacturonan 1,4-alpha-galacturonidase n=1 Tax=Exidia glandulosa HHB12029 TaxID=1314781 RepID=A0A165CTT8_EXIGL|nr:pectin lyase-like protein [Exidia glandulosa HHB12029]
MLLKAYIASGLVAVAAAKVCSVKPLGAGKDDTDRVLAAIDACGTNGFTSFAPGTFNITRKMTWTLNNAIVDLRGTLSFLPDVTYWLNASNTYRVVDIQSQASWFVVTGKNFVIDAHGTGGIDGNGQTWWDYFATRTRLDGDGRPIAFTLFEAQDAIVRNFKIFAQPFWCNTAAKSARVVYDGMTCNATNTNPTYAGQNIVPNTDGINTYRSDRITMLNWDITCGDDCLAIKGNSTNIIAKGITCRGGNGIAIGSLGQYVGQPDIVENVTMQNLRMLRLPTQVQPNMKNGVYLKTWTGSVTGTPPTGGGGGGGRVHNLVARNVSLDRVDFPVHLYQTNSGHSADAPSQLAFSDLRFEDWTGSVTTSNKLVDIECSPAVPCPGVRFDNFAVPPPSGQAPRFICVNVVDEVGLPAPCNATGLP